MATQSTALTASRTASDFFAAPLARSWGRPRQSGQAALGSLGAEHVTIIVTDPFMDLSWAGDVDGDGYDDFIVGSPSYDVDGTNNGGAAWVVFGRGTGFPTAIDLASEGWQLLGTNVPSGFGGDSLGQQISAASDFNGDGLADVAVNSFSVAGADDPAVFIVYGKTSGFNPMTLASMGAADGLKILFPGEAFNVTLASAGDVNADGYDDLIVGNGGDDGGGENAGAAWLVFGKATPLSTLDLATLAPADGFKMTGDQAGDAAGLSVGRAGDVNRDGFDDFLIGAPASSAGGGGSGVTYLIFGSVSTASIDLTSLSDRGVRFVGPPEDFSGVDVSSAGDINGDGYVDMVVGANFNDGLNGTDAGAAYVVFGSANPSSVFLSSMPLSAGFKISGPLAGGRAGQRVTEAGDINGDGFDDLIVSAWQANIDGVQFKGAIYILYGKPSGYAPIDLANLGDADGFSLKGDGNSANAGRSVSMAGDVNGDGLTDLLLSSAAQGHLILSSLPTTSVNRVGTLADQNLVGGNLDDILQGLGGDDALYGNNGADSLDGGPGADAMRGGSGNDIYFVDDLGDIVVEVASGGTDTVRTTLGSRADPSPLVYVLPTEVENLIGTLGSAQLLEDNASNNVITTTNGADFVYAYHGGNDTVSTGAGNDFLFFGATFSNLDTVDGGAGVDRLGLYGDYALPFGAGSLNGIERLMLYSTAGNDFDYDLFFEDAALAAGGQLEVVALSLSANETLTFNGSAESDGSFWVRSGAGDDMLIGGAGADRLVGGLGADAMTGGGGADRFDILLAAHSTGSGFDTLHGFDASVDRINIAGSGAVAGWGDSQSGDLSFAGFDTALAGLVDDHLAANGAIMVTATGGDQVGKLFVVIDMDGNGAYTSGADYVFAFETPVHTDLQTFPFLV